MARTAEMWWMDGAHVRIIAHHELRRNKISCILAVMVAKTTKKPHRIQKPREGVNLTLHIPEDVLKLLQDVALRDLRSNGNMAVVLVREAIEARIEKRRS